MIPRTVIPPRLLRLASCQAGALSRPQVRQGGLSDRVISRLLRDGVWTHLAAGVYATRDDCWEQRAWAGLLIGGERAVLGERSAAFLEGLCGDEPSPITVYLRPEQRVSRDARWRFIRSARDGGGRLARTSVPQTVVDLSADLDTDGVVGLVANAAQSRPWLGPEVERILERTPRHPNRALLLDILADVAAGAESPLERRYLVHVERAHGLPAAERQAHPSRTCRTDVWYRAFGLLVELDGRRFHEGLAAAVDMARDNEHRLSGLVTLRYGWRSIAATPCLVAQQVGEALRQRGWTDDVRRCRRCRGAF